MIQAAITGPLETVRAIDYPDLGFAVLSIEQRSENLDSLGVHVRTVEDAHKLLFAATDLVRMLKAQRDAKNVAELSVSSPDPDVSHKRRGGE